MTTRRAGPAVRDGLLARLAAMLFGVSTPLVQWFGVGIGAFSTAAALYAGAAAAGALLRRPVEFEARLRRADSARLLAMAALGAVVDKEGQSRNVRSWPPSTFTFSDSQQRSRTR